MKKYKKTIIVAVVMLLLVCVTLGGFDVKSFFKNSEESKQKELEDAISQALNDVAEDKSSAVDIENKSTDKIIEMIINGEKIYPDDDMVNTKDISDETSFENGSTDLTGEILDRINDTKDDIDYGIMYRKAEYLKTLSGCEILANVDGEEKVVKLIGVDEEKNDPDMLEYFIEKADEIYLEFDVKRTDKKDRLLAYVWTDVPGLKNKDKMINAILVRGGYATAVVENPNIKYAYYLVNKK